jgi:hypothetical protein
VLLDVWALAAFHQSFLAVRLAPLLPDHPGEVVLSCPVAPALPQSLSEEDNITDQ